MTTPGFKLDCHSNTSFEKVIMFGAIDVDEPGHSKIVESLLSVDVPLENLEKHLQVLANVFPRDKRDSISVSVNIFFIVLIIVCQKFM